MQLYALDPPKRWQLGTVGNTKPIFMDCGRCEAREPEIHGFAGTGPTYLEMGLIKIPGSAFVRHAAYCGTCWRDVLKRTSATTCERGQGA